jgi:hypothetical protein
MLDAILPAIEAFRNNNDVVAAARQGANATATIGQTSFGRASYVPDEHLVDNDVNHTFCWLLFFIDFGNNCVV